MGSSKIRRIVDRSPGYSELANPRSRILIKLHMSDLIRHRRAVTTTQSSEPPAQPTSAATAPALMDHSAVGPAGSQAPASSASSVAQPVSARRRHRPSSTTDTTSTDASGSQTGIDLLKLHQEEHRGPCRQLKTTKVTRVTNSRINIGYDVRHRVTPTAELHSSLAHDIDELQLEDLDDESLAYVNRLFSEERDERATCTTILRRGVPKELEGREDSWSWLCAHFQAPAFVNKAKVNKGNRGSKFPEIDVFGDIYVRPGNELAESLHTTVVERSQLVLQESASQLPSDTLIESVDPPQDAGVQILTKTLD
ncbi:hypothetical protein Prudu_018714 [Prunus dulcis]|uniref:Uncharacterized protein n=1 Tax=Prunus dulcis TaxID=3755 RepID=A0A4Y1RST3_PRUDU|nr:hypothetical protein Prudu_018714 [Prunus dulcis]